MPCAWGFNPAILLRRLCWLWRFRGVSPATFLLPGLGSNTLDRMPFEPSTAAQPAAQVIARAD